jgi:transposase
MRFAGIDIASEKHVVAVVDGEGAVVVKATPFTEDKAGYDSLLELLGPPAECVVAMEATGHYWQNLFAVLAVAGFRLALINPLRTNRFAQEDLARTKTDAIDALGIARFAQQKRPAETPLLDVATQELKELVRLRERVLQDMGDAVRRLHRSVDLGFPEFTRYVKGLDSELATTILHEYPTAAAFPALPRQLAKLVYDGRHKVGGELAAQLVAAAKTSVGQHHGDAYRMQVQYSCEDIDLQRQRLRDLEGRIETTLRKHEVGKLLTTIDGIGPMTAARIVAEVGDFARFRSAEALAAYVGVIPGLRHSGKNKPARGAMTKIGHAKLRQKLWMPVLVAVRRNVWLRAYYKRLRDGGKPPKLALIASMRKLLHAIYSVATNKRAFVPRLAEANS